MTAPQADQIASLTRALADDNGTQRRVTSWAQSAVYPSAKTWAKRDSRLATSAAPAGALPQRAIPARELRRAEFAHAAPLSHRALQRRAVAGRLQCPRRRQVVADVETKLPVRPARCRLVEPANSSAAAVAALPITATRTLALFFGHPRSAGLICGVPSAGSVHVGGPTSGRRRGRRRRCPRCGREAPRRAGDSRASAIEMVEQAEHRRRSETVRQVEHRDHDPWRWWRGGARRVCLRLQRRAATCRWIRAAERLAFDPRDFDLAGDASARQSARARAGCRRGPIPAISPAGHARLLPPPMASVAGCTSSRTCWMNCKAGDAPSRRVGITGVRRRHGVPRLQPADQRAW